MSKSKKPRVYDLSTGTVYKTVGDFYENAHLTNDRASLVNVEIQKKLSKVAELRRDTHYSVTLVAHPKIPSGYRVKALPDKEAALDLVARWPHKTDYRPSS